MITLGEKELPEDITDELPEIFSFIEETKFVEKQDLSKEITTELENFLSKDIGEPKNTYKVKNVMLNKDNLNNIYFSFSLDAKWHINNALLTSSKTETLIASINKKFFFINSFCVKGCTNYKKISEIYKITNLLNNQTDQSNTKSTTVSKSDDTDLVEQIKKLNDLYKSGVLTKEEFKKAKKKILN